LIVETLSQWEFWNFSPYLDYRGITRRLQNGYKPYKIRG